MTYLYWSSTGLICLYLLFSSGTYLFSHSTVEGVRALGFPDHFRIQLAAMKLVAVAVLLTPSFPQMVKEWAYAGVGLFIITAIVAHHAHQDPIWLNLINVLLFALLALSRWSMG